jgi:diphosphomevalonate decarboxylase
MNSFLGPFRDISPIPFESIWESPSNIAFVKYWGKKGHQIPANPSLSMALSECKTTTKTIFAPADELRVSLNLEGQNNDRFAKKIQIYLESLAVELPWVLNLSVVIETSNTFPHGAGIASSASGLSAFALTLTDYLYFLKSDASEDIFFQRASYLSRIASGSACRSVFGGYSCWGDSELSKTTNEYAIPLEVHSELSSLNDTVLVISGTEKNVSSRTGHERMNDHFFAESRFTQAKSNFNRCVSTLRSGDVEGLGIILEAEALSLHAMMLTSPNPYMLLKPKTLSAIEAVWDFRRQTKIPLYFSLDAGPNLHLIYPDSHKHKIDQFITSELSHLSEKIIFDRTGNGPRKC